MAGRLTGLRAAITGGSSGIGAATARELAARGVRVAIAGRNAAALERVAADTNGSVVLGDLREPGCAQHIIDASVDDLGGLDILVSNAGIGWAGPFASMSDSDIDAVLDVNLRAAAHLARAAIPHLRSGRGRLVFVGSIAGLVGVPGETWYSATKAGLGCLAETLRAELRPAGIGVSLVSPGVVDTAYFERRKAPYRRRYPRLISAETAAAAVVNAIEHGRDDVVVPPWLSLPARVKVSFPGLYRLLASRLA
ncbi:MAG TPA: SDR family oxidoreductase [Streptosporangiaceae bacterium]|jgi:NAD(P)-dependent dehydrogenase (short-subunit alcohol dehydrogenase family)|nr:SDR family oxidoreductase [Streptosporangiaceae bacterium]